MQEISIPTLYETPLKDHSIIRFDLLAGLEDIFGHEISFYRDMIYTTISGKEGKEKSYNNLRILYRTFPKVKSYIMEYCLYEDYNEPVGDQVITHLVDLVKQYRDKLLEKYDVQGIRFLVETNGYLYFSPRIALDTTESGVKVIC